MSEQNSLYDLALTVPWLITPAALEAMLSIAAREPLPTDELAHRLHGPKALALRDGTRRDDSERMTVRDGVALIPIDGPIYRYADAFTAVSGGVTTDALARDFQKALDDPAIAAILFVLDSPGGEATGINELADMIYAARGQKPMAAYIEGYGASAAYWIASATDEIVVDDQALVGSIGVVMGVPDPAKRISRTIDFVSSQSPKKRADPTTESGKGYIQGLVDAMTDVFVTKVARNRGVDESTVLADFGQGGLLVGQAAVDAGLADHLGSEEGTIAGLVARAKDRQSSTIGVRGYAQEGFMSGDGRSFWAQVFGGAKDAGIAPPPSEHEEAPPTEQPAVTPTEAAEIAQLRTELAKVRAERITAAAEQFVKEQIALGHAYAAEQQALTALYVQAATDDAASATEPSRVALLNAAISARPAHRLSSNLLPGTLPAGALVLQNDTGDDDGIEQARQSAAEYGKRANGKRAS